MGFNSAKDWSSHFYKKIVSSSETTAHMLSENVKLDDLGTNLQSVLKKIPLLKEFEQSQSEFAAEHQRKHGPVTVDPEPDQLQANVLPWHPDNSGLTDEAIVKKLRTRILALSQQPNTFLLAPPNEAKLAEETARTPDTLLLAKALLEEDPNLGPMRYKLVPSKISENLFWRNYFYRLSTVRQSFQLSAMTGEEMEEDNNDFVCIDAVPAEEQSSPEKQSATTTEKKSISAIVAESTKPRTKSNKKSRRNPPSSLNSETSRASPTKPGEQHSEMSAEDLLEAELAREVDELVLIPSKNEQLSDELDRELEMELMAALEKEDQEKH